MTTDNDDPEWITKDGRVLKMRDMSTQHLNNCLRLMVMRGPVMPFTLANRCASFDDVDMYADMVLANHDEVVAQLEAEIARRAEKETN